MSIRKGIIVELALIVIAVAAAILMYNVDLDLILFKIYTTKSLEDKKIELEQKMAELENTRVQHKNALNSLESAKSAYSEEKNRYEAISEETLSMINNATSGDEYNLEYMWVSLGNYAKQNNLSIVLYEPGASTTINNENASAIDQNVAGRSTENMRVKVTGTYLNVAEFFYQVENDRQLRFKLDNIRMEYLSNNNIAAIFEVKGLVLNK